MDVTSFHWSSNYREHEFFSSLQAYSGHAKSKIWLGMALKTNENSWEVIECLKVHWLGPGNILKQPLWGILWPKEVESAMDQSLLISREPLKNACSLSPLYTWAFNLRTCKFYKTTMHRWKLNAFYLKQFSFDIQSYLMEHWTQKIKHLDANYIYNLKSSWVTYRQKQAMMLPTYSVLEWHDITTANLQPGNFDLDNRVAIEVITLILTGDIYKTRITGVEYLTFFTYALLISELFSSTRN